ncbi:WecB/TagA/CpsF family glycosyltransferase [Planococcus sp. FY231025]|uniref:WecB/TagA/CpsF family glycosyltransferase n=1 Tax=Planococcus sp. FY231025 TaxID=3455699 RepID=UPI003F8DA9D2
MSAKDYQNLGNVKISAVDKPLLLDELVDRLERNMKARVYFINAHCFNIAQQDPTYRQLVNEAEYVLNDGIGIELGAKLFGIQLKENLNGTDFTPEVMAAAGRMGKSVYLLGGKPGVAEKAGANIRRHNPGLRIAGSSDGYFDDSAAIVAEINKARPDLLLVGLGVPLQEKWIAEHFASLDATLFMAVGAFLDFTSGSIKRAPPIFRNLRAEWLFRLLIEPKRMWKRYLVGNFVFFFHVFRLAIFPAMAKKV